MSKPDCQKFVVKILNRTGVEIKAKRFQYTVPGGAPKTETLFFGGGDRIKDGETKTYTRTLQGIGDEFTTFNITYQKRSGSHWGPDRVHEGNSFKCHDNGERLSIITGE